MPKDFYVIFPYLVLYKPEGFSQGQQFKSLSKINSEFLFPHCYVLYIVNVQGDNADYGRL